MCNCITLGYHPQANALVENQSRTMEDCIRKYADENQNWLELSDGILFSVYIAKYCSPKYRPFHIMYNRDPVTPFQLALNKGMIPCTTKHLWGVNSYRATHFTNGTHLPSQQKYYNMWTFKNSYKVGEKDLKKNMAEDSCHTQL